MNDARQLAKMLHVYKMSSAEREQMAWMEKKMKKWQNGKIFCLANMSLIQIEESA